MPWQDRALRARRELVHAGQGGQVADIAMDVSGQDHVVDVVEKDFHFGLGFALEAHCQERGRRLRDGAAGALKADLLHDVVFHLRVEGVVVPADGIVALRPAVGVGQHKEVPRTLVMVEDELLVEVCEVVKHAITCSLLFFAHPVPGGPTRACPTPHALAGSGRGR